MIVNHLKTTLRSLRSHKLFSLINVLGLSIGISAALVIYLIVRYEFSFDRFQKDGNRIYRVVTDTRWSGTLGFTSGIPDPLPEAARMELTGLDEATALYTTRLKVSVASSATTHPAVFMDQKNIVFADNHYFRMFPFYQWLAGSPKTALRDPFNIVLTDERASTYFPGIPLPEIIGRQLICDDSIRITVSGIVKTPEVTTDLTFREFISMATITSSGLANSMGYGSWNAFSSASQFFVKLAPGTSPASIETQLVRLRTKYVRAEDTANITTHHLQPLADLHFNATYGSFDQPQANRSTLYGLILVAAFLLVLACINFINLTTALSSQRAKEIGIRKTLGSSRSQLIRQFLGESFLITLFSLALSLLLTPWLLHIFSDFIPPGLHFDIKGHPDIVLFLAALLIVVSLLSGFYPALVLSRFQPLSVLKNRVHRLTSTTRDAWLRKLLTTSQFVIAQCFIMATLIVGRQIRFSLDTDLGFKKDGIVYFAVPTHTSPLRRTALLRNILSLPGVSMVATGGSAPSSSGWGQQSMEYNDAHRHLETQVQVKSADSIYLTLYHLRLLAGRNFQTGDTTRQLIINETYANILGFTNPQQAIGKTLRNGKDWPIVGVVADFHQASTHTPIKPLIFTCNNNERMFHIALQPSDAGGWTSTLAAIGNSYKHIFPDKDFTYHFFDESIEKFYIADMNISRLLQWATGLTILISCLGLTGLVIFTTTQRAKEVSIRKILGASVAGLLALLSRDYLKLIAIAFLIATPLAWWASNAWLDNFAYRAPVGWWLFPLSGTLLAAIALSATGIRTLQAATANPVDSLRSE